MKDFIYNFHKKLGKEAAIIFVIASAAVFFLHSIVKTLINTNFNINWSIVYSIDSVLLMLLYLVTVIIMAINKKVTLSYLLLLSIMTMNIGTPINSIISETNQFDGINSIARIVGAIVWAFIYLFIFVESMSLVLNREDAITFKWTEAVTAILITAFCFFLKFGVGVVLLNLLVPVTLIILYKEEKISFLYSITFIAIRIAFSVAIFFTLVSDNGNSLYFWLNSIIGILALVGALIVNIRLYGKYKTNIDYYDNQEYIN